MTLLRRIGNKAKIASKIIPHFPKHSRYCEPFFGGGGMFFNKPRAQYNFLNDIDNNVFNCFNVLMNNRKELKRYIEFVPYDQMFFKYCKTATPRNDIEKAVYFLVLSNWGFMGKPETLRFSDTNSKRCLLDNIEKTYLDLCRNENQFFNVDFRDVPKTFSITHPERHLTETFYYNDPPYLGTDDNYSHSFTEADSFDLFETMQATGAKWAMSEFDHPFFLNQVKERNLNIITIGERRNLGNRRTEILITNYETQVNKLF